MFLPMRPINALVAILFCFGLTTSRVTAQTEDTTGNAAALQQYLDSIDASIPYVTQGSADILNVATINVPQGYKFIPADKARMIVEQLWQNPEDPTVGGMIVKSDFSVSQTNAWAFILSYDESGYVKDEDADEIDYDEMLKSIQESEAESNEQRVAAGYAPVHILAWASKPYYDKDRKILHWAKKLQFGNEAQADGDLTLNYDVRILGRKGVLSMNAVGTMSQLGDINKHIPDVLSIAEFKKGYTYSEFNPSVDKVAAYTIGGLIAGKLLAKTGILLLLLKNIKLVALGIIALFGGFRKKLAGLFKRKKDAEPIYAATPVEDYEPIAQEETLVAAEDSAKENKHTHE